MIEDWLGFSGPVLLLMLPGLMLLTLFFLFANRRRMRPDIKPHTSEVKQPDRSAATDVLPQRVTTAAAPQPAPGQTLLSGTTPHSTIDLAEEIRRAAEAGDHARHARARIKLGDIAHGDGDLTTACEHWQIARQLLSDLGQGRGHKDVEERMRRNGCPTDWVLNNF